MKLLGFSAQKPLYQAWQQNAAMVKRWETETYSEIRAQARSVGATVYFAEEAGIRSDYHTGTTWAPVGETPVVMVIGRCFSLNMISAVSPRGDFRFMVHDGSVTSPTFKEFLERLMIGATRSVFEIVDGLPIHKSRLVQDYVALLCHVTHADVDVLWRRIDDTEGKSLDAARREWRGVLPAVMAEAADPVNWTLFFFPACKLLARRRCCR